MFLEKLLRETGVEEDTLKHRATHAPRDWTAIHSHVQLSSRAHADDVLDFAALEKFLEKLLSKVTKERAKFYMLSSKGNTITRVAYVYIVTSKILWLFEYFWKKSLKNHGTRGTIPELGPSAQVHRRDPNDGPVRLYHDVRDSWKNCF